LLSAWRDRIFTDKEFPPEFQSLICDPIEGEGLADLADDWKHYTFVRVTEIESLNDKEDGQLKLFKGHISPDDII